VIGKHLTGMAMDEIILDQARQLHGTIRELQQRLMIRSLRVNPAGSGSPRELTLAQITSLTVIHTRGSVNLKELAEATHVSPPSASAMLDRLSDLGLASREASAHDRREVRISLTPEGAGAVELFEGALLHTLVDLLQRLGSETASQWCGVYAQIQSILDDQQPAARLAAVK